MVKINTFIPRYDNRPLLKISLSTADRVLEALSWAVLVALWFLTFYDYQLLPDTIPVHFNLFGEPDRFDYKSSLFELPVVVSIIVVFLSVLCRFPQVLNYNHPITIANAEKEYRNAIQMLRGIKLSVAVAFLIIVYYTQSLALAKSAASSVWLLPGILGIVFTPLAGSILLRYFRK